MPRGAPHRAATIAAAVVVVVLAGSAGAGTSVGAAAGGAPSTAAAAPFGVALVWQRTFPGVTFRESSPVPARLSTPAVAFGALDGKVYALDAATGATEAGWPVQTSNPINSSPAAVDVLGEGKDQIFTGSGVAATTVAGACSGGGTYAIEWTGAIRWHNIGSDADCANQAFHSSFAIGDVTGDGLPDATIGALGLQSPSYTAASGVMNAGWPFYANDTVFATPALQDVNGDSVPEVILGGDATPGPTNFRGGRVRAITGGGQQLWDFHTDEQVRSSPAVGTLAGTSQPTIAFGTGNFWQQNGGATDSTYLFDLDLSGNQRWARNLGGDTLAAPALADVTGGGHADIVEGTAGTPANPNAGTIWVLDGNGNPLPGWGGLASPGGVIIGGISTADLNGDGAQDLVVPTGAGIWIFDGRTAQQLAALDVGQVGFQNTPLLTDDGGGAVGITVAGTMPNGTGVVQHFRVGGASLGAVGWPMFHHDARHTGNLVPPPLATHNAICDHAGNAGYWFTARDGGIFSFCGAAFHGSAAAGHPAPIVAIDGTPSGNGYWVAGADGSVYGFGDATFEGSANPNHPAHPIVGMATTPTGHGYWLVASDGGIFSFGDAAFHGSTGAIHLNQPIVGMAATPTGRGYWLVASDGGIFNFGDAAFHGSTGVIHLNQPIVGMAATPTGRGYWLVASDGGIFNFGDAAFHGSTGVIHLNQPIVGMAATSTGAGYWLVASDGGVFNFGDARFFGSTGAIHLNQPIVALAPRSG